MNLEFMAMVWLRVEKRCQLILRERTPREWYCGKPDVLGVMASRHMIEIEIKRSVSDFQADSRKRHRKNRVLCMNKQVRHFYYFVPGEILESVKPKLPPWAGLLYIPPKGSPKILVDVPAPKNDLAERLTVKECLRLTVMLSNCVLSSESAYESNMCRFRHGHEPYLGPNPELHFDI